jgi:DNA-binding transcriptional MerR regulator
MTTAQPTAKPTTQSTPQPAAAPAPTPAADATMTIGEVSALTGLTTYTLRFYEQEGLFFAPVRRNAAGRRVFTREEVEWLKVCTKLRSSGMPLPEIQRYATLVRDGAGNEAERFEILRRHEAKVQQQVADLQEALGVIHHKVELYARHLAAGTADRLWRNGPECDDPVEADVPDPRT